MSGSSATDMKKHLKFVLAILVLIGSVLFVYLNLYSAPDPKEVVVKEFPSHFKNWRAREIVYDKQVLSVLSPDLIVYKSYKSRDKLPPVQLFMSYYNNLGKADCSHSPIVCLSGQGWKIETITKMEIPIGLPKLSTIRVNQMILNKMDTTMIALFWFQSANNAYANRGIQKLSLFAGRLMGRRDNNAFVRVTTDVPRGKSVNEVMPHITAFVRDLYPVMERFFNE